jgi:hypothetical protein
MTKVVAGRNLQEIVVVGSDGVDIGASNPLPVALQTTPTIDIGDVTLLAGEAHIGAVGGHAVKITGSITKPSDNTVYDVRDVIGTAQSANITLANIARVVGGGGMIFKVRVVCDANQTTKPTLEVWLFDTAPAAVANNAAFAPTDVEMLTVQAVIPLSTCYVGAAGAAAAGNCILISDVTPFSFKCTGAVRDLYACLVVTNAYTPVAADVFTLIVDVEQD